MGGSTLIFDELRIHGCSRAGDQSWFRVDPPGLALDVGRGAEGLVGAPWIFISHGHLDHSLGLPWVLSQRRLQGLSPATVFCHDAVASDLTELLRVAGRLDGVELEAKIVGLEPGDRRDLSKDLLLEAFAVDHAVPALGCHLVRRLRKLRPELGGMSSADVAGLKREGRRVTDEHELLWLSYCGDTGAGIFSSEPRVFEAEVLLVECTFMGDETRDLGARFGHLHLSDFVEHAERFANRAIVLSHLSRRHRPVELERAVAHELLGLAERIHVIGARETAA